MPTELARDLVQRLVGAPVELPLSVISGPTKGAVTRSNIPNALNSMDVFTQG